jgi:hypothetical protein
MAASQGKAAARSAEEAVRPQPQRFRVNVPVADEAVIAWMGVQDNHSLSVRMLIRESIERHGYIDVMNRPVDQLPKRGRPAATDAEQFEAIPVREPQPPAPAVQLLPPVPEARPVPVAPSAASADLDLTAEAVRVPELLGIALEAPAMVPAPAPQMAAAPAASMPAPASPEPSSSGQFDVNDIFTSIR